MLSNLSVYGAAKPSDRQIAVLVWLVIVAILVFAMVTLGGVTRLTNSGLSMVDWKPVTGWLPPLSEAAWQAEFDQYKAFPEYQKINKGMSLGEFKQIFVFEYSHRLLGRLIGLVFAIPFLFFVASGRIKGMMTAKMLFLLFLGGAQGFMGWYMVKSGLVDDPDVSHYRLTAHLGLACIIYSVMVWFILDLSRSAIQIISGPMPDLKRWSRLAVLLIFFQLLVGGLVAGLNAGFVYNEWPLMGDGFIPDDLLFLSPWYWNFLENLSAVQFFHRMVAYVVGAVILYLLYLAYRPEVGPQPRRLTLLLCAGVAVQIVLGILTLVFVVPVSLGVAHQAGGLLVLTFAVILTHELSSYRR